MHGNTTMRELNILYDIDIREYVEKRENLPVMSHINVTQEYSHVTQELKRWNTTTLRETH